jgi:hypothetical protein
MQTTQAKLKKDASNFDDYALLIAFVALVLWLIVL